MNLPKRKPLRLKEYDYSKEGAYFITICTKERREILSHIPVGDEIASRDALLVGDDAKASLAKPIVPQNAHIVPQNAHIVPQNAHIVPNQSTIVPDTSGNEGNILTDYGLICDKHINRINSVYTNVNVDKYVIMPDHIHMILFVTGNSYPRGTMDFASEVLASSPTKNIAYIVRSFKTMVSREIGFSLWQRSYYDHIIRNEKEYYAICNYIKSNIEKRRDRLSEFNCNTGFTEQYK